MNADDANRASRAVKLYQDVSRTEFFCTLNDIPVHMTSQLHNLSLRARNLLPPQNMDTKRQQAFDAEMEEVRHDLKHIQEAAGFEAEHMRVTPETVTRALQKMGPIIKGGSKEIEQHKLLAEEFDALNSKMMDKAKHILDQISKGNMPQEVSPEFVEWSERASNIHRRLMGE